MTADRDFDAHVPAQRAQLARTHGAVLAVIALGGGLGALARYGISLWLPTEPGRFPWGTFAINLLGSLLIGVLMVLISERRRAHPLVRPLLGVGFLGGFTTFSTYAVEAGALLRPGSALTAGLYLVGTPLGALVAVLAGVSATRALVRGGAR